MNKFFRQLLKFIIVTSLIFFISILVDRKSNDFFLGILITFCITILFYQRELAFLSACIAEFIFEVWCCLPSSHYDVSLDFNQINNIISHFSVLNFDNCYNFKVILLMGVTALLSQFIHLAIVVIIPSSSLFLFCFELFVYFFFITPALIILSILSRLMRNKKIDIGIGPQPLINNIYHKKAISLAGYSAETYVENVYFITSDFDYRGDHSYVSKNRFFKKYANIFLFIRALFRYKCLYIYFTGGPLRVYPFLKPIEPYLLKLADIKVVVMPYGADVNDMHFGPNYKFKHALNTDYPSFHKLTKDTAEQINRWTENANYVISGCDWVDYTYYWDKLVLAHFSVDVDKIISTANASHTPKIVDREFSHERPLRVFHAPNHKTIKGSRFLQQAIEELISEGYPIEIILVQGKPNHEILKEIAKSDVVADQLVIGWYAMFALEGLSLSKPVICYLREDLIELFLFGDVLGSKEELPFINTNVFSIKSTLKDILLGKVKLSEYASKALPYLHKYHSVESVSQVFKVANQHIGLR